MTAIKIAIAEVRNSPKDPANLVRAPAIIQMKSEITAVNLEVNDLQSRIAQGPRPAPSLSWRSHHNKPRREHPQDRPSHQHL